MPSVFSSGPSASQVCLKLDRCAACSRGTIQSRHLTRKAKRSTPTPCTPRSPRRQQLRQGLRFRPLWQTLSCPETVAHRRQWSVDPGVRDVQELGALRMQCTHCTLTAGDDHRVQLVERRVEHAAAHHRTPGAISQVCPTDVLFGRLQWGLTWLALALPAFPSIRCLRVSTSPPHVVPSGSGKNEITLLPPTHRTARVLKYRGVEVREVLVFDRSERCRFVSPPPQPPPREVVAVACLMI